MNPNEWLRGESIDDIRDQRDRFVASIANVTAYTEGRTDITGEEIAALLRGEIPERLRGGV